MWPYILSRSSHPIQQSYKRKPVLTLWPHKVVFPICCVFKNIAMWLSKQINHQRYVAKQSNMFDLVRFGSFRQSNRLMKCLVKNMTWWILYFPIPHNALCLPPRFCINYYCEIFLGICTSPKSISQQLFMQNLGGKHSALWGIGK